MVPISRGKQIAGVVGAVAVGYVLAWVVTPDPGTGPVDTFGPTFGQSVTPVIVNPVLPRDDRSSDPSTPSHSSPEALQIKHSEPI
jgi:dolichol kinase